MRLFISTGEVSGDLLGGMLIEALARQALATGLELEIVALGGDRMAAAGATILSDTTTIGSVGLLESLPYLFPTLHIQRQAKQYLRTSPPDLVVLIDYLGPNLGIGTFVRRYLPSVPVVYYIAPQEWVWSIGSRNTHRIVDMCDRLLAIFPEEARYYHNFGAIVNWVGHPLIDLLQKYPDRQEARQSLGIDNKDVAIALIPASRRQEIKYLLPVMLSAATEIQAKIPAAKFWIPLSQETYRQPIEQAIERSGLQVSVLEGAQTRLAIAAADLAIAKSGTVNLEIALLNVPQVVIYRVNPITAWIARHILKFSIPFMSPPNLVLMKPVVPELLQEQATPANIVRESLELLQNPDRREQILHDYQQMRQSLGEVGACDRAAALILQTSHSLPS